MNIQAISNYSKYNDGMKKSLLDKIFFMDKIDATVVVDYGSADGTFIDFLSTLFPEYVYAGFDIDPKMVELASEKVSGKNGIRINFSDSWEKILSFKDSGVNCLNLSSVIHEVHSYGTKSDVDTFWNRVFKTGWDYIVIRDMIPSRTIDKQSDINDIKNILKKSNSSQLNSFEKIWGSIENNKNLVHYLLKYKYIENWEREVRENYLPIFREELLTIIPDNYEIIFHEHFILPYLKNCVRKDFGIELKDNTHMKLILKKKDI